MQPSLVRILSTASGFCRSSDVSVSMLVEVIKTERHRFLGAVEDPGGFGS